MYLMSDLDMREMRDPMYSDMAAVMIVPSVGGKRHGKGRKEEGGGDGGERGEGSGMVMLSVK